MSVAIVCLALLVVGYLSAIALFWTIPTGFLSEKEQQAALPSSAALAGSEAWWRRCCLDMSPDRTGSLAMGVGFVALVLIAGGCSVMSLRLFHPLGR